MLRKAEKLDIVRQGLQDLHEANPDTRHFGGAEIARSAYRHHPRHKTRPVIEDGNLPFMLRRDGVAKQLAVLIDRGEAASEFLEDGEILDLNEYRRRPSPKPALDSRDAMFRLLNPVREEPLLADELPPPSPNGNGASPEADENKPPVFLPAQVLNDPLEPHIDGFDPPVV